MEFRLVVEAPAPTTDPVLALEGKRWSLSPPLDIHSVPEYTCISYVWGAGRLPNPFHTGVSMSDHTVPALAAAIRNSGGTAFWMDAFCVPTEKPRKRATLESMGFIYSRAERVVVVLAEASMDAFAQMTRWDAKTPRDPPKELLDILEEDKWVRSVWTYQEVVNSQGLYFTGEGGETGLVRGDTFLNGFGYFADIYKRRNSLSTFDYRQSYYYLDAFEDLIADYMTAGYGERSAYQVLSSMQRRVWDEDANYFYSMIGAITSEPSRRTSNPTTETLADVFMVICEAKGDYSFIFTANERDSRPGMGWRPAREILRAVLPWHTYGDGQLGERDTRGVITLKRMALLSPSASIDGEGRDFIATFTKTSAGSTLSTTSDSDLAERLHAVLKKLGFTGSDEPFVTASGIFFAQQKLPEGTVQVWASTGLVWVWGTPGLVVVRNGAGKKAYISGVYVGTKLDPASSLELVIDDALPHQLRL